MIDDSQLLLKEFLQNNCIDQMIQLIKEKHINILHFDCGKKQTIFHTAVQRNDNQLLKFLETYCYDNYKEQEIRKLINAYNIEMFTALHLASYSGNMEAVKILTQLGADSTIKSGSGLLPIHAAAQGDQPYIIWYWLQQGISINVQDDLGNTCLHWATYQNCELTVNYLIAYGCEIDFLNNQKQTSLHIGSLYGQTRIVKKLLIKGAKRNMEDEDGQLPINLTDSIQIRKMLEDKMDLALFYNLKQPYHPIKRNKKSIFVFYFVIITSQICIGQILSYQKRYSQILIFIITQLILITISLLTQFSNAGIIKRKININDAINEQIDPQKICPDCWVQKPERSKHCEFCKKCIIVYDHHCPWINNCVGAKNLLSFYFYLLILILLQLESISFIILYIIRINSLTVIDYLIISYPMICITIFIFPITALFFYQTKNLYYGITTYERITGKKVNIKASLLFPEENIQDSQSGELEIEPSFQNCYNQCIKNKKIFKKYL